MNGMSVAGRRGEVLWKKGRQYDCFVVRLGLVVPIILGELVHIWDIPSTVLEGGCKGIRLRPDPAFKRRVLFTNWAGWSAFGLLIGCPFLWASVHTALGIVSLILGLACLVFAIMCLFAEGSRNRNIRLVLGPHSWGSSDPATWHKSIGKCVVDPMAAFEVETFAKLARRAIKKGEWSKAMWAARLCVLAEDKETGEDLTDTILDDAEIRNGIFQVARYPEDHKREFGKPPPLKHWLTCDPVDHVMEIG